MMYVANGDSAAKAVGASNGLTIGDDKTEKKALIDDLNRRGGINGRRVKVIFAPMDFSSAQTIDQQQQAACAAFTQDAKAIAAIVPRATDTFKQCMAAAGAIVISGQGSSYEDSRSFARFANYFEPAAMNLDRIAATLVPALNSQGYFRTATGSAPARVGVVTYDVAQFKHAVDSVLLPALKAAGYPALEVARVPIAGVAGESSGQASQISGAVLRFRSLGINRVIFLEASGFPVMLFLNAASSQKYTPRYGMTSQDATQALVDGGLINDPKGQLKGAMGIGWQPRIDNKLGADPYANAKQATRCAAVMRAARVVTTDATSQAIALMNCDMVWFFEAALTRAHDGVTPRAFADAVGSLGDLLQPASTIGMHFSTQRHDGAATYRYWQWNDACPCFRYVGSPQAAAT